MATPGFCDWTLDAGTQIAHTACGAPAIRVRMRVQDQVIGKIAYRCEAHIAAARSRGFIVIPEERQGY